MVPTKGEIYWAKLPYEKNVQSGRRPVVVWQNQAASRHSPTVHVVPLTRNVDKAGRQPTHVFIVPSKENGLKTGSVALGEDIRPIHKSCLLAKIGTLGDADCKNVMAALKVHLDITG